MKYYFSGIMKSLAVFSCTAACSLSLFASCVPAAQASGDSTDEKPTIYDLFSEWEENSSYPDWVASISSTDGSMDHMTVIVISDEGEEELLSMISNPDDVQIFVDTQTYSYNSLVAVRDEIIDSYMGEDSHIISVGLGWATDAEGNVVGFGESNTESRVIVEVEPEYLDQYTEEFADLYQDMVYVETATSATVDDGADTDNSADTADIAADTSSKGTLLSIFTQVNPISIIVFALGVFMILVSIIITRTGRRK